MKKFISVALVVATLLAGCGERHETVVYQQAPAQVEPMVQPVVVQTPPSDANLAAGMIIGAALTAAMLPDGHLRPGYVYVDGRVYRDTPYVRRYSRTHHVRVTNVVNVKNVTNVTNVTNKTNAATAVTPTTLVAKIKNPGDAAAEAQKAQMQKQADLKAQLQAKQAARAQATPAKSSGFASFSQRASSISSGSSSSRSGGFNSMSRSASSMSSSSSRSGRR